RRDRPDHLAALEQHGIALVDVVVVNLYPFADAAANSDTPFDELIEEIDIGGPSLIRAAAKNFRDVLVIVDPNDYEPLLEALDATPTLEFRFDLMRKAFAHTAAYDRTIAATLSAVRIEDHRFERTAAAGDAPGWPALDIECVELTLHKVRDLRYGENPHQRAAWYRPASLKGSDTGVRPPGQTPFGGAAGFTVLQGRELSFTNLLDLDAALRIALDFDEPASAG